MLVSMDELQMIVINIKREKVNTQEPPTIPLQVTHVQPLETIPEVTSTI